MIPKYHWIKRKLPNEFKMKVEAIRFEKKRGKYFLDGLLKSIATKQNFQKIQNQFLTRAASSIWIIQYQKHVSTQTITLWPMNKKQLCSFTDYFMKKIWFIYVSDFSVIPWLIYENCIICWYQRKANTCVIYREIMNSTVGKKRSSSLITM